MIDFVPDYILFVTGLLLLLASAEFLVKYASKLASAMGKSSLFIGMTFTAFGTSAPELTVGITDVLNYNGNIGLGNIVGSNIFNILFVLGITALIRPIIVHSPIIWRDIPILLIVSIIFLLFGLNGVISSYEAMLLVLMLLGYLYYLSKISNEHSELSAQKTIDTKLKKENLSLPIILIFIVTSITVMVAGAHFVVTGAVSIAKGFGVSELITGLTIVAIGTSLPEIATTIAAVRNNEHELAIGNVMGSCFFNIVAVPAVMALIGSAGLIINTEAKMIDIPVMLLAVIACLPIFFSGHRISRSEGLLFLLYFCAYSLLLYTRSTSESFITKYKSELSAFALIVVIITFFIIVFRATKYYRQRKKEISL